MENQQEHGSAPRNVFLLSMIGLGTMLALAVHQVPQPWRGLLVGWLLFVGTFGALMVKVLKHHYAYKSLQLTTSQPLRRGRRRQRRGPGSQNLKVIESSSIGSGRSVIR